MPPGGKNRVGAVYAAVGWEKPARVRSDEKEFEEGGRGSMESYACIRAEELRWLTVKCSGPTVKRHH